MNVPFEKGALFLLVFLVSKLAQVLNEIHHLAYEAAFVHVDRPG